MQTDPGPLNGGPEILEVGHEGLVDAVRTLFREYEQDLGVDLCFQGFEEELAGLPAGYLHPDGALWLARQGGVDLGCVGLRRLDRSVAEMKRLFIRPAQRGAGLGRRLALLTVDRARELGYRHLVLDTLETLRPALALYRDMGFRETAPYNHNPLPGVVYLALDLH